MNAPSKGIIIFKCGVSPIYSNDLVDTKNKNSESNDKDKAEEFFILKAFHQSNCSIKFA